MREIKIETMEDLDALPEGEWVEVPDGLNAKFYYDVDKEGNKLTIILPKDVSKRLGGKLSASFDGSRIVIEST